MSPRVLALASIVSIVAHLRVAEAQTDPVAAEALFDAGRTLMSQGKFAEACPKLAESERLDPAVGTLLNLGDCYDKAGQVSRAWATFREADAMATRAGQADRSRYAQKRAKELQKRLVQVTIVVPEASRVPGLEITRDGEVLRDPLWGTPLPLDPGTHTLQAHAAGFKSFETTFDVGSQTTTVTIPALEKLPDEPAPPPPAPTPAPAPAPTPTPTPALALPAPAPAHEPPPPPSGQKTAGIVIGVVGVIGLGTGAVFGALAMGRNSDATNAGCDKTTCPTQQGLTASGDAQTLATMSTASFILGGVALAAGVVLWLTAPKAAQRITALGGTF